MTGLVIRNTGSWYDVRTDDGQLFACKVKGNFRLRGIRSTNPVAVGDRVEIRPSEGDTAFITEIHDRRNYIIRRASNLSKQSHIIAANVDLACLVVTIAHPETSTTFIDRFVASAEAYRVPVALIFNKIDLYDEDERRYLEAVMSLYRYLDYPCFAVSAETGEGVDALVETLRGKISLFSGNSGVGKSTLLNRLVPDAQAKTGSLSEAHDQGQHTTTFSEMFDLPSDPSDTSSSASSSSFSSTPLDTPLSSASSSETSSSSSPSSVPSSTPPSGAIIDTPGIRGFGTFDFEREEVSHYFREIFAIGQNCRFGNCTHTHEPGCAVLAALENHEIAESRYHSYLSMLDDEEEGKYRAKSAGSGFSSN